MEDGDSRQGLVFADRVRDRIIVTSAVGQSEAVAPRTGLYIQNMRGRLGEGEFRFVVYCLDWRTGKILWEKTAYQGRPQAAIHAKNSYATATPVADGEPGTERSLVVACFGTAGLFCYGLDGQEIWSHRWEGFRMRSGWGPAASPIIHQGRVYAVNDNESGSFLLALDQSTGKQIWKVARDEKSNWSSPVVWKNALRTEIVTTGSNKVRSYDLDGRLLWELGGMSSIHIPTPVATKELLYVDSGYVVDQFRPVYAIRPARQATFRCRAIKPAASTWPSVCRWPAPTPLRRWSTAIACICCTIGDRWPATMPIRARRSTGGSGFLPIGPPLPLRPGPATARSTA